MKRLKIVVILILLASAPSLQAGAGYTAWAVPSQIITTNDGMLIVGAFGNPGGCGSNYGVIVQNTASEYNFIKATVLAALMGGKQVQFYIYDCYNGYDNLNLGLVYPYRYISIKN
ncbi:MAG: hypothetical protein HY272_03090 [Gammaproteobacteria bacterium]|nr:hypothetical protein [Gammaproteobacteria bacterium]